MFNPFTEVVDGDTTDVELVEQARNGDRAALGRLVLRHQAWIYNIAVRMVFQPQDVERIKDVAAETVREIDDIVEGQYAAIYRDHPFLEAADQVNLLRQMLESQEVRAALHLN
jgi:hypothetical protein